MADNPTPIYGFHRFANGDHGWGEELNENFDDLEALIAGLSGRNTRIGTEAQRADLAPEAQPVGMVFVSTDYVTTAGTQTPKIWVNSGTAWIEPSATMGDLGLLLALRARVGTEATRTGLTVAGLPTGLFYLATDAAGGPKLYAVSSGAWVSPSQTPTDGSVTISKLAAETYQLIADKTDFGISSINQTTGLVETVFDARWFIADLDGEGYFDTGGPADPSDKAAWHGPDGVLREILGDWEFETTEGAQDKADAAVVTANAYTDAHVPSALTSSIVTATNASWPIPAGATKLLITAIGGGGGGGGGGSAAATQSQRGGGGGASGAASTQMVTVGANTTLNITIGNGGTGGTGGAAGGNLGNNGTGGGTTTVTATGISVTGFGGAAGAGSAASSTTAVGGGVYGAAGAVATSNPSGSSGGQSATAGGFPIGDAAGGSGGGGTATATNGGGAGGAGTASSNGATGASGASGTADGVTASNAGANSGAGGPGGGGGAAGTGAGGAGGNGGSGRVRIIPLA